MIPKRFLVALGITMLLLALVPWVVTGRNVNGPPYTYEIMPAWEVWASIFLGIGGFVVIATVSVALAILISIYVILVIPVMTSLVGGQPWQLITLIILMAILVFVVYDVGKRGFKHRQDRSSPT